MTAVAVETSEGPVDDVRLDAVRDGGVEGSVDGLSRFLGHADGPPTDRVQDLVLEGHELGLDR